MSVVKGIRFLCVAMLAGFSSAVCALDVIIHTSDHYITKERIGDYVEFSIELVSDFEDNVDGKYPDVDFFMIYHDVNGNGRVDENIDRYYTYSGGQRCAGFLLNSGTTVCSSFKTQSKVSSYFSKSKIQQRPHPIFKYLFPVDEIFTSNDYAYLVFSIWSKEGVSSTYPMMNKGINFDSTLKIKK